MERTLSKKKFLLERIIQSAITPFGFQLIQVIFKGGKEQLLKIFINRIDNEKVRVDDCKKVSEIISTTLAIEGVDKGTYSIEVSSAGIERPLIKLEDFQMFLGQEIKVKLNKVYNGKTEFKGTLISVKEKEIVIDEKGTNFILNYDNIKQANRIFTDELLKQLLK